MIVVVGGESKNCGKTTAVCQIIAATPEANWTGIKITSDAHGADLSEPVFTEGGEPHTDTGRYLESGARRAVWIRCLPEHLAKAFHSIATQHAIVESNSILEVIKPDLFILLENPESKEPKISAQLHALKADFIVSGPVPAKVLDLIRSRINKRQS